MARKDSNHQKKSMSALFRGKAIFKPLNTGRIDEHVACIREWVANIFIAALTAAAFFLRKLPVFSSGQLEGARTLFIILGVLFILSGAALWIYAVPISKIDDGIKQNRLVTAGAYALVRNPIYSAAMIACARAILIIGNAWLSRCLSCIGFS